MIQLPRPRLLGGAVEMVAAPPSPEQEAAVAKLVQRAERIRNGGVDPRQDNMLAITTDGRKVALDMRILNSEADDFGKSKINLLVERVFAIWTETRPSSRSRRLIDLRSIHDRSIQDVPGYLLERGMITPGTTELNAQNRGG